MGKEGDEEGTLSDEGEEEDADSPDDGSGPESPLLVVQQDLMGLCFSRSNPRPVAEVLCRCFLRKAREPGASPAAVLSVL